MTKVIDDNVLLYLDKQIKDLQAVVTFLGSQLEVHEELLAETKKEHFRLRLEKERRLKATEKGTIR